MFSRGRSAPVVFARIADNDNGIKISAPAVARRRAPGPSKLFGHHLRLLFLLRLALHGPATTRSIAQSIGTTAGHACTLASHLERCGFVTKNRQIGARWYIDLDDTYVGSGELRA